MKPSMKIFDSMKYDFDEIIPRRGTNSYKWDTPEADDILPMWVADMDFRTAPAIIEALRRRVSHGIFGYTKVPDSYYEAVTDWFEKRHHWHIDPDWMIYTSGVVPAVSAILKALTKPGDKVIVQTPAYNCFFSSIRNDECVLSSNDLIYKDGRYTVDFEDLEEKAQEAEVLLLCNPHNPSGRVWTADELRKIGDICMRHNVFVVSDEIHCELTYEGHDYVPFASLSEKFQQNSVTCISPSKAFNIAGLQIANIVAADENIRRKIDKAINVNEVCDVNPFGVIATIAAYNEGGEWLDELREYLYGNYGYVRDFFKKHLPEYPVLPLEGTYLVWIDCRASGLDPDTIAGRLESEYKLLVNSGTMYGSGGECFIRLNIACPHAVLQDGLERMAAFFLRNSKL